MDPRHRFQLITLSTVFFTLSTALLARSSRVPSVQPFTSFGDVSTPDQAGPGTGMNDPAAVYCVKVMGYEYQIQADGSGGQKGACVMPDSTVCDEWDFLNGKCGQSFSYCAQQGMDIQTLTEGGTYSPEYAVCVDQEGEKKGSIASLTDLPQKSLGCGAGILLPAVEDDLTGKKSDQVIDPNAASLSSPPVGLPTSFDWRNASYGGVSGDWLTPVKNQGSCGSCWAFSAVGTSEAALNIAALNPNLDVNLAEEYLVSDCYMFLGYQTCCGGFENYALQFIRDNGVPDEACMTYTSGSCSCYGSGICTCAHSGTGVCSNKTCSDACADVSSRLQHITTTGSVAKNQTAIKNALLTYGPLSVAISMSAGSFDGDIFKCASPASSDHAVIVVGYDDAKQAWIVKNSWGSTWNGNGYFYIGYGQCNIEQDVEYASAKPYRTISGYVRTSAGAGISAVTMIGLPRSPATDSSGFYTDQVIDGWSGTVTPQKFNYVFDPVSLSYSSLGSNQSNQNFTGTYQVTGNPILLVDDDDNTPDVQSYYTDVLNALGKSYDVWNTNNSDVEPDATALANYDAVIWFTGHEYGGYAGPGSAGTTALTTWLDAGGCFLLSSQDYYYDKGLTSFASTYLGVSAVSNDVSQTTVTGAGSLFSGLGPYTLSYPFTNYSDIISPNSGAENAFSGDKGNAAVDRNSGVYRTAYFGFPFEAILSTTDRQDVMSRFLNWCAPTVYRIFLPLVNR